MKPQILPDVEKVAAEIESQREFFLKAGSPQNLLSRNPQAERAFSRDSVHFAPATAQNDFAYLSMTALASVADKYKPREIFKLDEEGIDATELRNMEKLYATITMSRYQIADRLSPEALAESTQFSLLHRLTKDVPSASTNLTSMIDGRYDRYINSEHFVGITSDSKIVELSLNSCLAALDEPLDEENIPLGQLSREPHIYGPQIVHSLGSYRNSRGIETPSVKRVDYVTALAAKKSYIAHLSGDEDKALQYALVFNTLRGHNIRSMVGACWAQEISTQWLLTHEDKPLFQKKPGIYLDIESCTEKEGTPFSPRRYLELIEREKTEYKTSLEAESDLSSSQLFDHHLLTNAEEFETYKEAVIRLRTTPKQLPSASSSKASGKAMSSSTHEKF